LFEPKEQLFTKEPKETLPVVKFEVHMPMFLSRLSLIHSLQSFQLKPTCPYHFPKLLINR